MHIMLFVFFLFKRKVRLLNGGGLLVLACFRVYCDFVSVTSPAMVCDVSTPVLYT